MKKLTLACVLLFSVLPLAAQEVKTVVFEGNLFGFYEYPDDESQPAPEVGEGEWLLFNSPELIEKVRWTVSYDESQMLAANIMSNSTFFDTFIEVEIEFLDAQGAVISQNFPTLLKTDSNGTLTGSWHYFEGPLTGSNAGFAQVLSDTYYLTANGDDYTYYLDIFDEVENPAIFETTQDGYIRYVEYFGDAVSEGSVFVRDSSLNWDADTQINMESVFYIANDDDSDGINDAIDACLSSSTSETVRFGDYDSGVSNYIEANGCTVTDRYAGCPDETETAMTRGIRSVRSGPSNCEKQISYDLVAEGIIDYQEARALRSALYQSYR